MSNRPWMPMYWEDYLADTLDLGPDQHGVYLLMLGLAWRRPDGALPSDMALLKRMLAGCCADMHGNRFNRLVPPVLERFWTLSADGKWRQNRLEKERETAEKRSGNARESAKKRWSQSSGTKDLADATAMHARVLNTTYTEQEEETPPSPSSAKKLHQEKTPSGGNGHTPPRKKGSRVAPDWQPSESAVNKCREMGCVGGKLQTEYEGYLDWALSAGGSNAVKVDHDRAFVNWVRKEMKRVRETEERERRWAEQRASKH
jgi:uncharacterized protein YdaU (DUF1376 family)